MPPREIQLSSFREVLSKLVVPVVVKRYHVTLGTWYPYTGKAPASSKTCGHGPLIDRLNARVAELEGQVRVLTPPENVPETAPATRKVPVSAYYGPASGFGHSRPAPKPVKKQKKDRWAK